MIEPDSFRDRADYLRPDPLAEGARFVLVNGSVAVENDRLVSRGLGRVLDIYTVPSAQILGLVTRAITPARKAKEDESGAKPGEAGN